MNTNTKAYNAGVATRSAAITGATHAVEGAKAAGRAALCGWNMLASFAVGAAKGAAPAPSKAPQRAVRRALK